MSTFKELGLRTEIQKAIADLGFEEPTPVQAKAIPQLLESPRDLIAYAQTGTGKTAAFSLPIIQRLDENESHIQALILNPTRELCLQTSNEIKKFLKYLPGVEVVSIYGGDPKERQARLLRKKPQIIVGTPGRVLDFIKGKQLKLQNLQTLVLDEADEMLTMGFKDELDAILATTPETRQTLLFSATMPKDMKSLVDQYMNDPLEVNAGTQNISAENIQHTYATVRARDKYNALKRFADYYPDMYGIVFCRTRLTTKEIADELMQDGYASDALHGDLSQAQRDHVMNRFRNQQVQILVATDVAARGLDINNLTHVIHFHLPDQSEAYIHRSGRTGRAGNSGMSIALVSGREKGKVRMIEKTLGKKTEQIEVPSATDIRAQQLLHFVDKLEKVAVEEEQITPYLSAIESRLSDWSKEDLLKRVLSMEFNRFLQAYDNAPDLNFTGNRKDEKRERRKERGGMDRYYISLGKRDNITPGALIKILNQQLSRYSFQIGSIELLRNFSFFQIEKGLKNAIEKQFRNFSYNGKKVVVEFSSGKGRGGSGKPKGDKKFKKKKKKGFKKNYK
ncbi:MAG: DEAD/DEAH box helicase [Bacteroidota bacterium]